MCLYKLTVSVLSTLGEVCATDYGTMKEPYHPFRSVEAKEKFLRHYDKKAKTWPVASESQMVKTSYGETFVRKSGPKKAQALVLLHGDTENLLVWLPQIEAFSKNYRVYAVDQIFDNGRSIYSRPVESADDFVQWLNELFDGLGLENDVNLMGFSYGGWQAGLYALSYPDRLNKLVLVSPSATVLPVRTEYLVRAVLPNLFPNRFFLEGQVRWETSGLMSQGDAGQAVVGQMVEELILAKDCFKPRKFVMPTVLQDADWQRLKVSVLFMVGENEVLYSAQKAVKRLKAVAPKIQTAIIPNASHGIIRSQAKLVHTKVLDFLQNEDQHEKRCDLASGSISTPCFISS